MKREKLRTWFARHVKNRLPEVSIGNRISVSPETRGLLVFHMIIFGLVMSLAGTLAGAGFFIISMVLMNYAYVAVSSVLFAFSVSALLAGYLWATP